MVIRRRRRPRERIGERRIGGGPSIRGPLVQADLAYGGETPSITVAMGFVWLRPWLCALSTPGESPALTPGRAALSATPGRSARRRALFKSRSSCHSRKPGLLLAHFISRARLVVLLFAGCRNTGGTERLHDAFKWVCSPGSLICVRPPARSPEACLRYLSSAAGAMLMPKWRRLFPARC